MDINEKQILSESIENLELANYNSGIIQDNKLIFIINDKSYRVRMPTQLDQSLLEHKRHLIQLDYLKQDGCISKTQLIQQLKTSGICDMQQVDERREKLTKELKQYWFLLATKSSDNTLTLEELTNKILKIQNELKDLAIDISTNLAPCMESRLEKFSMEYFTFLCTDILVEEKWVRTWNTFEEFQNSDMSLVDKCVAQMSWLLLNCRG